MQNFSYITKILFHCKMKPWLLQTSHTKARVHEHKYQPVSAFSCCIVVVIWNTREQTKTMSHCVVSNAMYSTGSLTSGNNQWSVAAIISDQSDISAHPRMCPHVLHVQLWTGEWQKLKTDIFTTISSISTSDATMYGAKSSDDIYSDDMWIIFFDSYDLSPRYHSSHIKVQAR